MLSLLGKLRKILTPRMKYAAAGLVCFMVLSAVLDLAGIAMLMPAVYAFTDETALQTNRVLRTLYGWSGAESSTGFITVCAVVLVIFYILKNFLAIVLVRCQSHFSASLSDYVAQKLFARYLRMPYADFLRTDSSELIVCINRIHDFMVDLILPLLFVLTELCVFCVIAAGICFISLKIAVFTAVSALIALLFFYLPLKRKMEHLGKINHQCAEKLMSLLEQTFSSLEMIRITGSGKYFENLFRTVHTERTLSQKRASDIGQAPRFAMETFGVLLAMGILLLLVFSGQSFSGVAVNAAFFAAALFRLMPSVSRIQYNLLHIKGAKSLFERIYHDLTMEIPEDTEIAGGKVVFEQELRGNGLSFAYENGQTVLSDVSFVLRKNECVALTGSTGSGKTTLALLTAGFLTPCSGTITADGKDIRENLSSWRSGIGYVPQQIYLLNTTVRENVAFGVPEPEINDARVEECLKIAQVWDFIQSLPEGTRTIAEEGGDRFSGGQRQRIAIARALYRNPSLLILDEATSALDNRTEKDFLEALDALKGKITILMIAHRQSGVEHCDRKIEVKAAN